MDNQPKDKNPQGENTAAVPKFRVRPFGLGVFTDLERGKSFASLSFRHKRAGLLPEQLDLVEIVVEDLAAAGLSPSGAMTLTLAPRAENPNDAPPPAFGSVLEVPVRVPGDVLAWCEAVRAEAAAKKEGPQ